MKKLFIIIFVILASVCEGQQSITWQRVYEGPFHDDDGFTGLTGDNLGSSYLYGYTKVQSRTGFYIVKIDQFGDTIWTKLIGGYGFGQGAYSGVTTTEGGLIFSGDRDTACSIRLSANGDVLWNKTYYVQNYRFAFLSNMIKTSDNGYIMCGYISIFYACIFKIDSSGNLQWYKIHTAPFKKKYYKVIEVENGYLIDGEAFYSKGSAKTVLLRINYDGDTIWEREYDLSAIGFQPSSIFLINNFYWIFGAGDKGLTFLKFDTSGTITDSISIYTPIAGDDVFSDVVKINNNRFAISSLRVPVSGIDTIYAEAKIIDSLGVVHHAKSFLGYGYTQIAGSKTESNGDLTFAGLMYYWQDNLGVNANGYAVRTDSNLNYPPVSITKYSNILPDDYILNQNYPNPFNPSTTISYQLPKSGFINITVYDITGKEVEKLVDEFRQAGSYEVNFTASGLPSGIYFYSLRAGGFTDTKKMVVIR